MKIIMQRLAGTEPHHTDWKALFSQHRVAVALAVVLLLGVAGGSLLAHDIEAELLKKLDFLFCSNYQLRGSALPGHVFVASAASAFLFILACFLGGLSVWGVLLVPLVVLLRGVGLGVTAGYLYTAYGIHGSLFYAVILLPGALCSCVALLLAAKEALLFSHRLTRTGLLEKGEAPKFSNYLSQYVSALALLFLGAGADALSTWAFAGQMLSWL